MPSVFPLIMLSSPRHKTFPPNFFPAMPILSSKAWAVFPHPFCQLKTVLLNFSGHKMSSTCLSPPSFALSWLVLLQALILFPALVLLPSDTLLLRCPFWFYSLKLNLSHVLFFLHQFFVFTILPRDQVL